MGQVTTDLLDDVRVGHRGFPTEETEIAPALDAADKAMAESELPYALIMEKGTVAEEVLDDAPHPAAPAGRYEDLTGGGERPTRIAALERLLSIVPDRSEEHTSELQSLMRK